MKRICALVLFVALGVTMARGQYMREVRVDSAFTRINLASGINLILTTAEKPSIKVEAERSVASHVVCQVQEGELSIFASRFKYKTSKRITVHIALDGDISAIDAPSGNRVRSDSVLHCENLTVTARNGSNIYLRVDCNSLRYSSANGAEAKLIGRADRAFYTIENGSSLRAFDLTAESVNLNASLGSTAEVRCTNSLNVAIDSDSEARYKGDPPGVVESVGKGCRLFAL